MNAKSFILFSLLSCILLISCSDKRSVLGLDKNEAFSLSYGNFEDELNIFDFNKIGDINMALSSQDGFYYVANGSSKKIMEFNSYGDLLNIYYNDETNPTPSFASSDDFISITRKATAYPFNKITSIAVDSRRYLYVVDSLSIERQEQDVELNQILSQVVLRFDESGNFIDYLGQQGPGGTPFPYIENIYGTNNNELVVVCLASGLPLVYWFSSTGALLYTFSVSKSDIANPFESDTLESWLQIEKVIPDYNIHKLYIKVDYFYAHIDESSRMQSGIDYEGTFVHPFDVETKTYGRPISVLPYTEPTSSGYAGSGQSIPYDFLGTTEDGWLFFVLSIEPGFSIQMVQSDGQKILHRNIYLDHKKNLFYTFNLSNKGVLSALLIQADKAVVDWWRTDNLIQSVMGNHE